MLLKRSNTTSKYVVDFKGISSTYICYCILYLERQVKRDHRYLRLSGQISFSSFRKSISEYSEYPKAAMLLLHTNSLLRKLRRYSQIRDGQISLSFKLSVIVNFSCTASLFLLSGWELTVKFLYHSSIDNTFFSFPKKKNVFKLSSLTYKL